MRLQNKCQTKCVVYKAEVITSNSQPKIYIGMTGNTFKEPFNNHKKSFSNIEYRNSTELSKYVWDLKERERDFTIQWSILKRANSYSSGGKSCNLCLQEKLSILIADKSNLLKKRRVRCFQNVSSKSGSWRENSSVEMSTTCHAHKQLTEINAIN